MSKSTKNQKNKERKHKDESFVTRMIKNIFEYDIEYSGGRKKK